MASGPERQDTLVLSASFDKIPASACRGRMQRTGGAHLAAKDVMSKTAREETEHGYRRNLRELQVSATWRQ